ncbi:mitochondrial ribosomal subunit protein-domain-containing protein [Microdochium trichocladiopsis]|uniref:Mitochondrial ribosomal subunit protein-domain-containing protein n=1 Tax=Microdochium trichocladiopsis TaxID=1682393 RepID=A0A9P9BQJ1_9PEZI|nr:mitochondrial ribosomal subunit protein-domain-containing protein [Microdochium trichocladiopsis]KAH7025932.1 mitochondrial ribosomal subunit protein-domain-containing protein [Microdochium trichocladiopsis]
MARVRGEGSRAGAVRKPTEFWYDVPGTESDLILDEQHEAEDNDAEDISTSAHAKFEQFREYREYARLAAWQLPLLSKLAKPFEPPTAEEPLRFRYTTYMGETHPAENKVVVEFSPRDLPLTEPQQLKLKKLLGVRYNPETEIAKISCEQYEHQAQNKRYLGDLVDKLIVQAKDTTDTFEDIPLDTRHHKFKPKIRFPVEWRMSEERRKFIDETREKSLLLDQSKTEEGSLIDGKKLIEESFAAREKQLAKERQQQQQRTPLPAFAGRGGAKGRPGARF